MSSNSPLKIMLVDDDETIIETLAYNLKRQGYSIFPFNKGSEAIAQFDQIGPGLLILDWMLPDTTGPEICKVIRAKPSDVPILMLTGRAGPNEVAKGLSSGADDYLAKPFSVVEMIARVQALVRRSGKGMLSMPTGKLVVDDLVMDLDSKELVLADKKIDLSPKEFSLLKVLMQNAGKTLSTETLLNRIWGPDFSGDVKTVAVHIRWLRQKLESDPKNPKLLETIQRSGYRLNKVKSVSTNTQQENLLQHGD
jgi:DNA-binding response OmpR family regulator